MLRSHPTLFVVATLVGLALACGGGGDNPNLKSSGNEEGGVQLSVGDIAVSTTGDYVVFAYGDGLAVGWTRNGSLEMLPVTNPSRLAFANHSPTLYVGQEGQDTLVAVDVSVGTVLWEQPVGTADAEVLRVDVSEDDSLLVAHGATDIQVFDAETGALLHELSTDNLIVDIDVLDGRAVIVEAELWQDDLPTSNVTVLDTETWETRAFTVPNCAATLSVVPLAQRAFMAPTTCSQDPVSVISLVEGEEAFEKNLPGFGPVSVAPDGWTTVAFYSVSNGDESLFDDPADMPAEDSAEYHLMIIDSADLSYQLVEYGDTMPRFTVAPDGQVILVDSAFYEQGTTLFDLATGSWRTVEGPTVYLDEFALESDGDAAYVLQDDGWYDEQGLFTLDLREAVSRAMAVDFLPTNLNLSPDDATLFLRETETRVCVYGVADEQCKVWFDAEDLEASK